MNFFLELLITLNFLINLNNHWNPYNKWKPILFEEDRRRDDLRIMSDFYLFLIRKSTGFPSDPAFKDVAEKISNRLNSKVPENMPEAQRRKIEDMKEAHRREKKAWDIKFQKLRSILDSEKEKFEEMKKNAHAVIRNHAKQLRMEEKEFLRKKRILVIETQRQRMKREENEKQRQKLNNDKAIFKKYSETTKKNFNKWELGIAEKEEVHQKRAQELEKQKTELANEETKMKEDKVKFHYKKEKAVNAIRYVAIVIIIGGVVFLYKLIKKLRGDDGGKRPSKPRVQGGGVNRSPERREAAAAVLDICHLSLTRERNTFFENVLLPRLAESNIHPRTERRHLTQPADFDDIPPARCYIIHWTSQRMSIYSNSWHHQGLLRALGDSPVMIIIYDSERMQTLPDPKIYDDAFGQIETERELNEAATERRLMTYRANEQFNQTQHATLRNWVNANIGEALNV